MHPAGLTAVTPRRVLIKEMEAGREGGRDGGKMWVGGGVAGSECERGREKGQ